MENILPEFTPVKHKKEGYEGWIHSITRMRELFTGETSSDWQYTITVEGSQEKRVAAAEDLEVIADSRKWPPSLPVFKKKKSGFREETKLHVLGYRLTDITPVQRRDILTNVAIPILGPLEVARNIADLIYSRLPNAQIAKRSRGALMEWKEDLDMILDKFRDDAELKNSNLSQYIKNSYKKMEAFLL